MAIVLNKTSFLDAPIQVESLHGVTFSNENKGHQFVISAMRGGELVALTGTVTAKFMRANNTTILLAGSGYAGIVDGKATVTLHQDCYNIPGRFQLAIFLTENGETSCIYACVGMVQRTQNGELIDSGDVVPSLEELLEKIQDCEDATTAANTAAAAVPGLIADTFSTSVAYAVGDYVYHDGNLYRFTADHEAGDWLGTDATACKIGPEVSDLKSAVEEKIGSVSGNLYNKSNITNRQYYSNNGSTVSSSSFATILIDIEEYSSITYSGITNAGSAAVVSCFFDADNGFVSYFKQATGTNTVEKPVNAKYVGFSINNASSVIKGFSVIGEKKGSITQDIENIVASIGSVSANLYSRSNITNRQYYKDDGTTVSNSSFATVLIDVSQYDSIIYSGITNAGSAAVVSCFFDANEKFVSSFKQAVGTNVIDRPNSAKYIGFSINNGASVLNGFSVIGASADSVKKDMILLSDAVGKSADMTTALNNIVGADTTTGVFNYQIKGVGKQDVIWSWWTRPACVHYKGVRDRIYYGYTTQDGYSGIGMYDCDSGLTEKTHLKRGGVDDHNACAVMVQPDRHILAAYPGGHNSAAGVFVRRSTFAESIEKWNDPIQLVSETGTVSYAQILYVNGKYWLFYRTTIYRWYYRTSTNAVTWSEEKALIVGSEQYYALFVTTSDQAKIRFCCTANPSYTDVNVRMGFIDTDTEAVYNADGTTVVRASSADKTTPINNTSFTILINAPSSGTLRLFDVLKDSAVGDIKILYALFSDDTDSKYYLYNNGSSVELCNGGKSLWNPKYQLGASFVDSENIVIARNDISVGTDIVEIAGIDGTVKKNLLSEQIGSIPVRNARPVVTPDGAGIVWQRGYYNSVNYTDFDMDACIYFDNKLVI